LTEIAIQHTHHSLRCIENPTTAPGWILESPSLNAAPLEMTISLKLGDFMIRFIFPFVGTLLVAGIGAQLTAHADSWQPLFICDSGFAVIDRSKDTPSSIQLVVHDAKVAQNIASGMNGYRAIQVRHLHAYDRDGNLLDSKHDLARISKLVVDLQYENLNPSSPQDFTITRLEEVHSQNTITLSYFIPGSEPMRRGNWIFRDCTRDL
jgi:hypothetical protein